jgi:transposase
MPEGMVLMSGKELSRMEVGWEVAARRMKIAQAAGRLGLSPRQIKRLVRAYRQTGAEGLVSRRRGKPSNHRFEDAFKVQVLARVRENYPDFGPTPAAEYLRAEGLTYRTEDGQTCVVRLDEVLSAEPVG